MSDLAVLAEPQRQSRWAIGFLAVRALRQVGIAQIALAFVFLARLPVAVLAVAIPLAAGVMIAIGTLAWWRFTFVVEAQELRVTKGILAQERLSVPLDRVQSVSLEQGFVHRLIGLVGVSVDTAGSSEAEFTIESVDRTVADALQRVTAEHRIVQQGPATEGAPDLPPPERTILQRDPERLLKAGIARPSFAGLAVLFPLFAVADDLFATLPVDRPDLEEPQLGPWLVWALPLVLLGALIVGLILNLVQVVLTQWNLQLTVRDGGLRRTAGLISRTSRSTNIDRIQWLGWQQTPLEQRFGIRRVRLPTIGDGDLTLPGTDDAELETLRELVIEPDARVDHLAYRFHPAQVFLETRNTAAFVAVLAPLLWRSVGPWALVLVALVPLRWVATRRLIAKSRWGVTSHGVARHREVVAVSAREVMLHKVNGVAVRQRRFERRRGLATVVLHTADGNIRIGMIPLVEATALRDRALTVVATDQRAWM